MTSLSVSDGLVEALLNGQLGIEPCTCKPGEGCDEEGDPGCAYCRSIDCELPCPTEDDERRHLLPIGPSLPVCQTCGGSGRSPSGEYPCSWCNGSGLPSQLTVECEPPSVRATIAKALKIEGRDSSLLHPPCLDVMGGKSLVWWRTGSDWTDVSHLLLPGLVWDGWALIVTNVEEL